jgi:hypothetical protein
MGLTRAEERAAWYLAGVFDGEGCVSFKAGERGLTHKYVGIDNTDLSIIESVRMALDMLGIAYNERGPIYFENDVWLPYYSIRVLTYESIHRFAEVVPVQSRAKRDKLDVLSGMKPWGLHLPDEEWERLYYAHSNLTAVARELGCNVKTVRAHMDRIGMSRRGRGWARSV